MPPCLALVAQRSHLWYILDLEFLSTPPHA
ncbi:hypothetical protein Gotur_016588 [Gossypium turneri]